MNANHERRALPLEIRTKGRRLVGYAATFNNEASIGGNFRETIAPGAFANTLRSKNDVLALVDHDTTRVLARTKSGTLQLSEDQRGLAFDILLPATQAGNDVLALAERGDVGGMSFGFTATDEHRDGDLRELRSVELHEISVVLAWPAYDRTIVDARSHLRNFRTSFTDYADRAIKLLELSQ